MTLCPTCSEPLDPHHKCRVEAGKGNGTISSVDVGQVEVYKLARGVDPFWFVEPCEPDCTPERHAYHQGQWDMAERIETALDPERAADRELGLTAQADIKKRMGL